MKPLSIGSYDPEDVTFLLKNLNGLMKESSVEEREKKIQHGGHYSEMLPIEYEPSPEYMKLFYESLQINAEKVALAVGIVSELILKRKGSNTILVSLARAGTPIGVLIKRYIQQFYKRNLPHYSISIIRGKGIDENALRYILQNHPQGKLQFIDGWTGKGTITHVLREACRSFEAKYGIGLDDDLAVLADPGNCVKTFGTREDFLIPSACLNSTVSGLVSRTVCRADLIGEHDFHGAKYYEELKDSDVSNLFIESIVAHFEEIKTRAKFSAFEHLEEEPTWQGMKDVIQIKKEFGITDINFIKPGIGETTRVLLRRIPWKVFVRDIKDPNLKHILVLAKDKNVPIEEYSKLTYACCGIVKDIKEY